MLLFFSFFFLQSVCYRERLVQYKLDKHSMRTFLIVIPETINSSKKKKKKLNKHIYKIRRVPYHDITETRTNALNVDFNM